MAAPVAVNGRWGRLRGRHHLRPTEKSALIALKTLTVRAGGRRSRCVESCWRLWWVSSSPPFLGAPPSPRASLTRCISRSSAVVSPTTTSATRGDHTHEGNDILAPEISEVVAAETGTVGWVSDERCAFQLLDDDGWSSWYIHLNNDSPGTDDGLGGGWSMASFEEPKSKPVSWWGGGDSGNAEDTDPHLHFELHRPNDAAMTARSTSGGDGARKPIGGSPKKAPPETTPPVAFLDIAGSVHAEAIRWLASQGITKGSTSDGTTFCPGYPVIRAQMASFLVRAMGYDHPGAGDLFWDDDGTTHETTSTCSSLQV